MEMATHSSILAQEIPWTEEHGGLQPMGSQKSCDMTQQLNNNISDQSSQGLPSNMYFQAHNQISMISACPSCMTSTNSPHCLQPGHATHVATGIFWTS